MNFDPGRRYLSSLFAVTGAMIATWATHIPDLRKHDHLTHFQLSLLLLEFALANITGLRLGKRFFRNVGSRDLLQASLCVALISLPLMYLLPAALSLLMVGVFAASCGILDVSYNRQSVLVEQRMDKPILGSFGGFYFIGATVGGIVSGFVTRQGVSATKFALSLALVGIVIALSGRGLLHADTPENGEDEKSRFQLNRAILSLGLLVFIANFLEGSIQDWGAVLLVDSMHVKNYTAAWAITSFLGASLVGRFVVDRVVRKFGQQRTLLFSCVVGAGSVALAVITNSAALTFLSFIVLGFVVSPLSPAAMRGAGRLGKHAVADVLTVGSGAYIAGPVLFGAIARTNIRYAFLTIAIGLVLTASMSRVLGNQDTTA